MQSLFLIDQETCQAFTWIMRGTSISDIFCFQTAAQATCRILISRSRFSNNFSNNTFSVSTGTGNRKCVVAEIIAKRQRPKGQQIVSNLPPNILHPSQIWTARFR